MASTSVSSDARRPSPGAYLARGKPRPLLADRERFERNYQEWLLAVGCTHP